MPSYAPLIGKSCGSQVHVRHAVMTDMQAAEAVLPELDGFEAEANGVILEQAQLVGANLGRARMRAANVPEQI